MNELHPPLASPLPGGAPTTDRRQAALPPAPDSVAETDLDPELLLELSLRHLGQLGSLSAPELARRLMLAETVTQELLDQALAQDLVGLQRSDDRAPRYSLRVAARDHFEYSQAQSGYCGPAPISLPQYRRLVAAHSVRRRPITRAQLHTAYSGLVVDGHFLDQLGRGLNSARALVVHGPSGSGKSYICERLVLALGGRVPVPYAIAAGGDIIPVYDPFAHTSVAEDQVRSENTAAADQRLVLCHRPGLVSGAELQLEDLELHQDPLTRIYRAPPQLQANNGVYVIDDFGQQTVELTALIRRLSAPLERHEDWLSLENGHALSLPFDVALVLITTLPPAALEQAGLRNRLTQRVAALPISAGQYCEIWRRYAEAQGLRCEPGLAQLAIDRWHVPQGVPLLPAYPGELLSLMQQQARYEDDPGPVNAEHLQSAWNRHWAREAPHPAARWAAAPLMEHSHGCA